MLDDRNDTPVGAPDGRAARCGTGRPTSSAGRRCSATPAGDRTSRRTRRRPGPTTSPGLPPTFIDVGSADTFRDEDVDYASRIWQAGGVAELHVWPGGFHGFDGMVPTAALSKAAVAARANWLARLLAS